MQSRKKGSVHENQVGNRLKPTNTTKSMDNEFEKYHIF